MVEPVTARIDILLSADGASAEVAGHAKADVILHCEATTAMLVIFGRLPFAQAMANGRVRVEGDPELATAFGQHCQGH
jgi:putative sterol carrier protein